MGGRGGFLEKIAGKYFREYKEKVYKLVFVFPNRRSSVYFREILKDLSPTPMWSPSIYSINDLVSLCSGLQIPETYELIFELFKVYREVENENVMGIENFFQKGKTILSDFNEIDKNLADTGDLFKFLRELKGLESSGSDEITPGKEEYLHFWSKLENIYHPFRRSLEERHFGYEGMAFRKVAEDISMITGKGWEKIIFAGFNALSGSERSIISQLTKAGITDIYWEMDRYFTEDKDQEAGKFFRDSASDLSPGRDFNWIGTGLTEKKKIRIIETTSDIGQVKMTGIKLSEILENDGDLEDTAVILPDENLLFPILNSLPYKMKKGNISIGFPLKQTTAYSMYESLMELHNKKGEFFYRCDLLRVLDHPYIKMISDHQTTELSKKLKGEIGTFYNAENGQDTLMGRITGNITKSTELMELLLFLINRLREKLSGENKKLSGIESEFIFQFYTLVKKLKGIIERIEDPVSIKGFHKMFNDLIGSVHIPFTGEPLEGLQILGVLEMQNLNFKNIFILSMNEDIFPSGKFSQTFIPQDVREVTGLPRSGEKEAVFAYHFYRMLGNSENITLLYSGNSSGGNKGERSRFIDQILLEYNEVNKDAEIEYYNAEFSLDIQKRGQIKIEKAESNLKILKERTFSATSIRTWIHCPLQFYFKYILRLRDDTDTDEAFDYAKFGIIFHDVLENIYKKMEGKNVERKNLEQISGTTLTKIIGDSFKKNSITETETGMNRITFEVIEEFASRFITNEIQYAPFRIHHLEKKVNDKEFSFNLKGEGIRVKLKGTIDRIDELNGLPRIIDYKTGKVDSPDIPGEMDKVNWTKKKEAFQLLFYTYLMKENELLGGKFKLGIYPFKKLSDKLRFIKIDKSDIFELSILEGFENVLGSIFRDMFDPEIPFTQTEDEKMCRNCLYKNICERSQEKEEYN
ncbi:MAG: PD-(D/E)XK nuclease family protein [Acidobacteriota bacterium]